MGEYGGSWRNQQNTVNSFIIFHFQFYLKLNINMIMNWNNKMHKIKNSVHV